MANNIKNIQDFIESGVPTAKVQRILLETAALTKNKFEKDPHYELPPTMETTFNTTSEPSTDKSLKVTLTLTLEGFYEKNNKLSNKFLSRYISNIDS